MGLFSFLKGAGKKTAKKTANEDHSAEIAADLRDTISKLNLEIENLSINVTEDKVTIGGKTESQATREKVILVVGNVEGIATVEDNIEVVKKEPEAQFYEVKSGDSLSKIAKEFYGDAMKYPVIFEANKPMLTDPDKIYPGQSLRIPPLKK